MNIISEVFCSDEYADIPSIAEYEWSDEDDQKVRELANLVEQNGLCEVSLYDYRVDYYEANYDEDPPTKTGDPIRTEGGRLHVAKDRYWFSAYLKHTDIEITTELFDVV